MGPSSRPMWPGQLELWIFFFFFFLQKPSLVPVTGGTLHLRPRGHDGPGFQADVARSAGALDLFFFFFQKPSCPRHRWHCTSEAERTLWARLPIRCGPVSWSFGSYFFFNFFFQKPSCPCHRWHGTSEAERTLWARLPGRCGPVSWSFGSFFFFFLFSSRSPLCPCHRGPCTSEAEGKLWARFSFIDLSVLSVLPVVRSTSCSFEVRFFSLWGHFWATSPGMTSRYSLWPVTFLPVSFMLVIFSICSYWTWR